MRDQEILDYLAQHGAVLTGSHFVFTSRSDADGQRQHGTAYINIRAVGHHAVWLSNVGREMSFQFSALGADLVLGPETLGRTLAGYAARGSTSKFGIWCDMFEEEVDGQNVKRASFDPKLNFGRLVEGKRVAIVDDLLTTGGSIKAVADLVREHGGDPVFAIAVVRRTPDVTAEDSGVEELEFLADVPGFQIFTATDCEVHGPCSQRVPMVLRPGHGHEWIKDHPDYPVA